MSMIETSMVPGSALEVHLRGALPVAPMAMPTQVLEWPRSESGREPGRFSLMSLLVWRRPSRAGR